LDDAALSRQRPLSARCKAAASGRAKVGFGPEADMACLFKHHAALLTLVFVEGALADPMAPAHVSRLLACFLFLDHLNDLFVSESRLFSSVLKLGGLYTKLEEIQGLRSIQPHIVANHVAST
jgi:hypothetical protein